MPRPQTKEDLLIAAQNNYEKLQKMISEMSETQLNTAFDFSDNSSLKEVHWSRDKNVRDLLIHLYEWQQLMIAFVKNNLNGNKSLGKKIAFTSLLILSYSKL